MHILSDRLSRSLFIHVKLIISLLSHIYITSSLQDIHFNHILCQQMAHDTLLTKPGSPSERSVRSGQFSPIRNFCRFNRGGVHVGVKWNYFKIHHYKTFISIVSYASKQLRTQSQHKGMVSVRGTHTISADFQNLGHQTQQYQCDDSTCPPPSYEWWQTLSTCQKTRCTPLCVGLRHQPQHKGMVSVWWPDTISADFPKYRPANAGWWIHMPIHIMRMMANFSLQAPQKIMGR